MGGGYSATEQSQSTKIYLNINFRGGGVFCNRTITKYQDLPKYKFSPGGGGYSATEQSQSTKIYLNINFPKGGGGGYSATEQSQSTKIYLNFPKGGGVFCN